MPPLPKSIIEKEKDVPTSRINLDVVSNPIRKKISPVPKNSCILFSQYTSIKPFSPLYR